MVYGILSIVLGIVGGLGLAGGKASPISMIAGGGVGVAMIGLAAWSKTNPGMAYRIAALITVLMVGRFFQPAMEGKWLGITMTVASIALFVYLGVGHMMAKRAKA